MNLRSGDLYWPITCDAADFCTPLNSNARCDVLVGGSGSAGAMAAYELSKMGVSVIVVDRRQISAGSTPASTALVQYEIDTPLISLVKHVGREPAQRTYLATRKALDTLARVVTE